MEEVLTEVVSSEELKVSNMILLDEDSIKHLLLCIYNYPVSFPYLYF